MRKLLTSSFCLLALCGAGAASAAPLCNNVANNLVTNCGFETGDFTGYGGTAATFNNPTQVGVDNQDPYQGTYEAFFGSATPVTLTQTLATVAGGLYTIDFALDDAVASGTTEYPNSFSADFGNEVLFSQTNVPLESYVLYSLTGLATGSSTVLSFTSENNLGFFDLDSISVAPNATTSVTPEPSSLLLMGTGLLGTVGLMRRRFLA